MMSVASGTMMASSTSVTLPSDYLLGLSLWFTGTLARKLDHSLIEDVETWTYDGSGNITAEQPTKWVADADNIVFNRMADQAYPYRFRYFAQPALLGTATTTNFLTARAPRLVRAACLWAANDFLKNIAERQYWAQIVQDEIAELTTEAAMEEGADIDARLEPS